MRKLLSILLAGAILVVASATARAQDAETRALIDKAIKAQGGLDKLSIKVARHSKGKGQFHTEGYTFTSESFSDQGGKRRYHLRGDYKNQPHTRILVFLGDKGWISFDGATQDLEPERIDGIQRSFHTD